MEKQKGKLKHNKLLRSRNIAIETPVAMDLSTDITRLFRSNLHKKKRVSEYMCESIRKTKMNAGVLYQLTCPLPVARPATAKDFVGFSNKSPSEGMPRLLEKRIKKMIQAPALEKRHQEVLAAIIKEAREEYSKVLRCSGINQKIKNCYPEVKYSLESYKLLGRTDRYDEYLLTRKRLKTKWILHYPIIRKVFKECVTTMPSELCHLKFDKITELDDITYTLNDKARSVSQFVYEFYVKILQMVDEDYIKLPEKSPSALTLSYLSACTGILSVHVSKAIARTILHIVKYTNSNQPYITLSVTFKSGLILSPTAEEIINTYHNFIHRIEESGKEIYCLQRNKIRGYENKYMPLCITEEFIDSCKTQVAENVERLYKPVTAYLENMSRDLTRVYPDINSRDFIESISDITFENGCEKIAYYREYLDKVAFIPDHEYFQIGQISLTKYRTNLHDGLKRNIDLIFEKLCAQHLWEINDLQETFSMIHTRAHQKSTTTEELIETGKYMNWIKNEHLDEITARVENSLVSLCQIIDLGFLSEDHIQLNVEVITWLDEISPVVEEHLVNFDQFKYDAEEKLQNVVEDVNAAIKEVYPLLVILDDMDNINRVNSYLQIITLHMAKIKDIDELITWINKEEVCLSFPKSTYTEYEDLKSYVYPFYHLLKLCLDIQRNVSVWQDGPFENLSYEVTKASIKDFYQDLTELHKSYRKKLRQAQDENLPIRFKGTIDDPDILNWPAPLKLCGKAMKLIDDFKPSVDVTRIICNISLRKRHWKAMSEIAGVDITPNAGTTLRKMMTIDFYANFNEYEIISAGATKEKQLIDSLKELELVWKDIGFTISKDKDVKILTQLDEIEGVADDHSIKILNMKGSVFVKPHEKEVAMFYGKIQRINETVDVWNKVQTDWVRLFPIFSTNNLKNVIPGESEIFNKVIIVYNEYIEKISENPNVMEIVETTDILRSINTCLLNIEIIHKGVVTYLEKIRQIFPRLYFISDDELIFTLSETQPLKSHSFLTKIFLGINELIVGESRITGIKSSLKEIVNFIYIIDINNNNKLEELYSNIEQKMQVSLKNYIKECHKIFRRNNIQQVIQNFPQQALQVVSHIFWTEQIKSALGLTHNIKLRIYYQKLDNTVKDKIRMVNETDPTNLDRLKLRNLIIEDLNLRYLVKKILDSAYISESQLDWVAHSKYYVENDQVMIQIMNSNTNYMYEYLGNSSPIVMTPLTDRCYRTLVNAHQFHFSGLLQGPGDTGKSETIRTLAAVFGVFFVTFSCFRNLNISTLLKFLTGSCLCGSWLCLENFNNLELGVLSLFSQNVFTVLSARRCGLNQCDLRGISSEIKDSWFITACIKTSYLYREIPDNLRVLFRSATLISPDVSQIVETTCYGLGLQNAKTLSKKIICFYDAYQDLMVNQTHYYFGISVLKEIFYKYEYFKESCPSESEVTLLFHSLKTILCSTIIGDDGKIIDDVLSQIFPETDVLVDNRIDLEKCISQYCEENNLQSSTQFVCKVLEMYDSLKHNRGIIILGDTFTGKTTIVTICEYMLIETENKSIVKDNVNPSSLHYEDLYGNLNSASLHWTDGILSKIVRNFSTNEDASMKWLILDGNIDSSWIESINDILNDNSRFHLESGETINLKDVTIIFEAKSLDAASPSTISRCRLIYMPSSIMTWREFVKSWINSCKSEWIEGCRELVMDLLGWIIPPCLHFIQNNCRQTCDLSDINLVNNVVHLTHMILDDCFLSIARKEEDIKNLSTWIQATLIYTGVTGLGSALDRSSMQKFDEFYKVLWKGQNKDNPYPNTFEKLEAIIPQDGLIYNYQYLYKQRGIWKLYQDFLKNEKIVEHPYMNDIFIPTADTLKFSYFLTMHINHQYPVLIIGPSGTGKSLLIEHNLLNDVDRQKYEISHINFNCNTNSRQTQKYIISKLNKRKNGRYSPPKNKNCLLFIDNLNLVPVDQHDSSCTLELLRQHFCNGPWYDLKNYNPVYLENINIISAMNPYQAGQKKLCKRFLRHFNVFSLDEFSDDNISRIYSNILLHTWKRAGFSGDIITIISQIVLATIKVYHSILETCKPTLNKCYYTFNLTDFTKVIKTIGNLKKETYDTNKKIYVNLWSHEIQRVFGDRLSDLETAWLFEEMRSIMKEEFNEEEETQNESSESSCKLKIIFSTFNDRHLPTNDRRYEELTDTQDFLNTVTESLKVYNNSHVVPLNIIFFTYAVEKLIKICRVVSMSPGNALLLGATGTGRQSLTKLACHVYNQNLFHPIIVTDYAIKEWDRDVKLVLKEAGALENHCTFLVNEEQLIDELFLQNLDLLLRNGEIPNLYTAEEKQEILELTRLSAQGGNRNLDISSADVFLHFNKKCKENLHLIINHSVGNTLRNRIRRHPSLMNCHVISFNDWPDESLECISRTWMKDLNLKKDIKQKLIDASIYFHREAQIFSKIILEKYKFHMHITSKTFMHLIKLFVELTAMKQKEIEAMKKRYEQGLARLSHAANQILSMQKSLAEYQPQLEEMTRKAVEMTEQIAQETIQVEKGSALVRIDEKIAGEQAAVAQALKSECEAELAQAIPILEDAISALNTLKPTDITLVKSMKNPPDAIKLVMAAVCVIKDVKPERIPDPSTGRKTIDYWGPSKRILGDMNFLQSLKDFDKDHIKPEIMVKIRKEYLPHKDFKPHVVAKASSAAEGLCKWIIAMDMYDKVAKEVAPKKEKLEKAEREYSETIAVLNGKKEELTCLERKLAELNEFLAEATRKQLKLQKEVDYCNKKLSSAQKLISSLSEERSRWTDAAKNLQTQYEELPGNLLNFSGMVAYLAPVNQDNRKHVRDIWHKYIQNKSIPSSNDYDVTKLLSSEKEIAFWLRNEIPMEDFFITNAIIRNYSRLYSIFVDPNYQASNWIQKIESKNKITLTKLTDNDYLNKLKDTISAGKPILIHKIKESIPFSLVELLQKETFCENEDTFIKLDDESVRVDENFRLYMVCNLECPNLSPEMYNRVTLINFGITEKALEEELLKTVIEIEKPEMKSLQNEVTSNSKRNKAELLELEEKILNTLCESEVDILEDETAINILDKSKYMIKNVHERQRETERVQGTIDNFKKEYIDIAKYSSSLFSCVSSLKKSNYIYQFSLSWYMDQYFISVLSSRMSKDTKKRCTNIKIYFTNKLYCSLRNSLLESDKLVFLFLLATKVAIFEDKNTTQELEIFLKAAWHVRKQHWTKESILRCLEQIDGVQHLNEFMDNFKGDVIFWIHFFERPCLYLEDFPSPWSNKLNNLQKLILLKLLRPDQLFHNIKKFILSELGEKFVDTYYVDLFETYNDSYSLSPIIIFQNPENNITQKLSDLARRKQMINRFKVLSLSSDQMDTIDCLIGEAQRHGAWVLVQNCHLDPKWMQKLEERISEMNVENTHENFRLWLTTKPSKDIPVELIQNSVKVVFAESQGVKNRLQRIYKSEPVVNTEFYNGCPEKLRYFSRLLYALSVFHCVLRERRKFGAMFSSSPYIFSDDDLNISLLQLQTIVNQRTFHFDYLEELIYIVVNCHYCGNIDNEWDVRMLTALLKDYLTATINDRARCMFNNLESYGLPKKNDYKDYLLHISKLPEEDSPRLFGLNELAVSYSALENSKELIASVLGVLENESEESLSQKEDHLISSIDEILKKLPKPLNVEVKSVQNVMIKREIRQYGILTERMLKSLMGLMKAFSGNSTITPNNEETAQSIINNIVPRDWLKFSYPHRMTLSQYIENLCQRIGFFQKLLDNPDENRFWLAAFFFPKSCICQTKIDFSKKTKVPLEDVVFDYEVLDEEEKETPNGVIFNGLFIKGAIWDKENSRLAESNSLHGDFPPVLFKPMIVPEYPKNERYSCPIFQTENISEERDFLRNSQNFIHAILLPDDLKSGHWIKLGVKITCQTPREDDFI